jgi:hypothetical protein
MTAWKTDRGVKSLDPQLRFVAHDLRLLKGRARLGFAASKCDFTSAFSAKRGGALARGRHLRAIPLSDQAAAKAFP